MADLDADQRFFHEARQFPLEAVPFTANEHTALCMGAQVSSKARQRLLANAWVVNGSGFFSPALTWVDLLASPV
ncbi:MAG TPA: hypothetical protein VEU62_02070 [Bryobacterales bacterium]|nr:hypothetical protein [Bryobacterales bacterium]